MVIQTDEDTTNWPPPPAAFPEGVATVLSVSGTTLVARAYENVLEEDMTWNLHTWIFTYTLSDDFASDVASWGSTTRNFIDAYDSFPTDQVCGRIWADNYVLDPTTGTIGDGVVSEPYFFPTWFWPRAVVHYWSNYFNHLKLTGNFAVDDTFAPNWGAPTAFMIDYWHFSTARILVEDGICLRDVSFDGSSFTVHSCTTCNNDETNWSTGLVVECPPGLVPRVNRWIEITLRDNWLGTVVGDACCMFT